MKSLCWFALLALPLGMLLVPAASADDLCIGENPTDGQCVVGIHQYPTSSWSHCFSLLLNPPVPGAYFYTAGCTPNFCNQPTVHCP